MGKRNVKKQVHVERETKTEQEEVYGQQDMTEQELANYVSTSHKGQIFKQASLIFNDLMTNGNYENFFRKYKKEEVLKWLENPAIHQTNLLEVSCYLYNLSNHYKRLIKYFARLPVIAHYLVAKDDLELNPTTKPKKIRNNYKECSRIVKKMNLKYNANIIFDTIFREDVFYGLVIRDEDYKHFFIKKLPYKACKISYMTLDGIYGISINLDWCRKNENRIRQYGEYIENLYEVNKNSKTRWVTLDIEHGFAIKWDRSVEYLLPPLVEVLPPLFDLEEYKKLKNVKEQIGNYKLLQLVVPYKDGKPLINLQTAKNYYEMIQQVVPENIGIAMVPGEKLSEVNFEKSGQTTQDLVQEATNDYFENAGVSSLLFGSSSTTSASISASTLVDSMYIYDVYRQLEILVNTYLDLYFDEKNMFKFVLEDVHRFNVGDLKKEYIEQATHGVSGAITKLAALNGNDLIEIDGFATMENKIFKLHDKFIPLGSSYQTSNKSSGRPTKDDEDLTDEGVRTREKKLD